MVAGALLNVPADRWFPMPPVHTKDNEFSVKCIIIGPQRLGTSAVSRRAPTGLVLISCSIFTVCIVALIMICDTGRVSLFNESKNERIQCQ